MKTLKKIVVFVFAACLLASCNQAKFDRIPGEKQESVPQEIQGTYDIQLDLFKTSKRDSFFIVLTANAITQIDKNETQENRINQEFYMFRLKNYWVLGYPDANFSSLWNLAVIESMPNGLRVYVISDEKKKKSNKLSRITPYLPERETPLNHEQIMSAPVPNGSANPMEDGKGQNMLKYFMMNDEQFLQYFEKELQGKDFIYLKKINPKGKKK
ncbi:MAG: hypothetical protein H7296_01450 [Bacteroidia bacterium]|nr:hypothetical protein [Bacteroidia bacterium]